MVLDKGVDVTVLDKNGGSALSYACLNGKDKIVSLLLDGLDYDINLPDKEGNTPLIYAAMSGNPAVLRQILAVVVKFGLNVDFRNMKGFSAYLMAAKCGHFHCAKILKTEGYASDCIRDSEFFLSDKEWAKKTRKELLRLQMQSSDPKSSGYRNSSRISLMPRPQTCPPMVDFTSNGYSSHSKQLGKIPRAFSRSTTRSEPAKCFKVNNWFPPTAEESESRVTSATSNNSLTLSDSSRSATTVPSDARTQTPDLHAIFNHYFHGYGSYPPVKLASFKLREAREREEAAAAAAAEDALANRLNIIRPPMRERKMSRVQAPGRLRKPSVGIR